MHSCVVPGLARLPSFCHAVVAGDYIFVSGTLGTVGEKVELVEGGIGPETTQILKNFQTILENSGAGMKDICKINIFIKDYSLFPIMEKAYIEYMGENPPARITVGKVDLALSATVEMDCVAYKPQVRE